MRAYVSLQGTEKGETDNHWDKVLLFDDDNYLVNLDSF